jgi:hypothetical protein
LSFTLAAIPVAGTVALYSGAARLWPGALPKDYTISGAAITMNYAVAAGGLLAEYVTSISGMTRTANEVVSGSALSYTLANLPLAGTVALYNGGARLRPGALPADYTISGAAITMNYSVAAGGLLADYMH